MLHRTALYAKKKNSIVRILFYSFINKPRRNIAVKKKINNNVCDDITRIYIIIILCIARVPKNVIILSIIINYVSLWRKKKKKKRVRECLI